MVRNTDHDSNDHDSNDYDSNDWPVPDGPPSPGRAYKRPKATIAAWVLVAIALAEVVVRFLDR